jgi:hypothetical protein
MKKNWTINPVVEAFSEHYGLDPSATDQWAIAMGDYIDFEVLEESIEPAYWKARIKYMEFLAWLKDEGYRFPHSCMEAKERLKEWLHSDTR